MKISLYTKKKGVQGVVKVRADGGNGNKMFPTSSNEDFNSAELFHFRKKADFFSG
jgi:hypothetical protein